MRCAAALRGNFDPRCLDVVSHCTRLVRRRRFCNACRGCGRRSTDGGGRLFKKGCVRYRYSASLAVRILGLIRGVPGVVQADIDRQGSLTVVRSDDVKVPIAVSFGHTSPDAYRPPAHLHSAQPVRPEPVGCARLFAGHRILHLSR